VAAGFALAAYLVAGVGIPLPASPPKKPGPPFPCQDHLCGCMSAEQCWRSCCCHTPDERRAWARSHGVEPPDYAERPAAHGWHTTRLRDREAAAARPACCARADSPHGCCGHERENSCCEHEHEAVPETAPPTPAAAWQWTTASLRCRGLAVFGGVSGPSLPPPAAVTWSPALVPAGRLATPPSSTNPTRIRPPVPPPRPTCARTAV
jgi:hypothetical protein